MKKLLILLVFFATSCCFVYSQPGTSSPSIEFARQGMKLFGEAKYGEAIVQYKQGRSLDNKNSLFTYEIALSYFMLKDYPACIATIDSVMLMPDANDQFYQLLGDAYDMSMQPDTALKVFKTGLLKFPKAANLSMESGVIEYKRKNFTEAHNYWINGIKMNAAFADNYYQLALFYADSSDRIPAILYSETYLNLSRNSAKVAEINKLICSLYTKSIRVMPDSSLTLRFSDNIQKLWNKNDTVKNFCDAINSTVQMVNDSLKHNKQLKSGVGEINKVKQKFIKIWFRQKYNVRFPFSLFDYEKQLLDGGYFESYSQWMLMKCNVFDFQLWVNENKPAYTKFVDWYKKHPFNNKAVQEIELCR